MTGTLKKIALIAGGVLLIGLGGNAVLLMLGIWDNNCDVVDYTKSSNTYVSKSPATKSIELDINSDEVRILRADVDRPTVHITIWTPNGEIGEENVVREELLGDVLHLMIGTEREGHNPCYFPFWGRREMKNTFEVLLPQAQYDKLIINGGSGSLQVNNLEAGILTVKTSSGKLRVENCQADEISFTASSGYAEMINCRGEQVSGQVSSGHARFQNIVGKLNITSSSGNIEVNLNEIVDDILIKSKSGNIDINVGSVHTPFRLEGMATSGKLDIDLPQVGNKVHGTNSFQGRVGQGGPLVKVEVSSGHAKIW